MKATGLGIALLFFGAGTLSAAPLDEAALDRAHKFEQDLQSGVIKECTVLEFTDGGIWLVIEVGDTSAYLQRRDQDGATLLDFKNMAQAQEIRSGLRNIRLVHFREEFLRIQTPLDWRFDFLFFTTF